MITPRISPAMPPPLPAAQCTLLGGWFADCIQAGLALAAVGTLVYKRHTETPRRPWLVWSFDASKQAFAGVLQHLVNLALGHALATSGEASECAWYLVNFSISIVCGCFILWGAMKLYRYAVARFRLRLLVSGEYGTPPSWRPFVAQLLVWGVLSVGEKMITLGVLIVPLHGPLGQLAAAVERPLRRHPHVELLLVMVVAPVLLNVLFFWVVDNLVMRRSASAQADAVLAAGGWPLSSSRCLESSFISPAAAGSSEDGARAPRGPRIWCLRNSDSAASLSTAPYCAPLAAGRAPS
ncbi:hypothetical protein AB1Y20_007753 [Prymnesium parvum]|uniref:Store-operated calcium entry regulator STIMATE n=1 Tax=Prymnesium parvum TaxID=97485 RepID=A0AB34IUP5_PRYPA